LLEGAVCLVPRLALGAWSGPAAARRSGLGKAACPWPLSEWWHETTVVLPDGAPSAWRHAITGQAIEAPRQADGTRVLNVGDVLRCFPVALLSPAE
jgi:maltooligosyltrehalose synthase